MNIPPPAEHLFNVDADWGKSEAGRPIQHKLPPGHVRPPREVCRRRSQVAVTAQTPMGINALASMSVLCRAEARCRPPAR